MKRIATILCFLFMTAALTAGCGAKSAVPTGAFNGQTYTNEFFGLTLDIPADWHIADQSEIAEQFGVPQELVGADAKATETTLKLGEQKTLYLLYVSEFARDHVGSFNTNVALTCENLKLSGLKVKTAKEYLQLSLQSLDANQLRLQPGEIDEEKLGRVKTASLYCELDINGIPLRQRHFAAIKNGYALLLTFTYSRQASVEELTEIQSIADSLKFK